MSGTATRESLGTLLLAGAGRLRSAGLDEAKRDAEWLLAGLLEMPRWQLHLEPERAVANGVAERFRALVERRSRLEPLQYLLGWEEFCGLRIRLTPSVMIPRLETELLVAWALEILPQRKRRAALEGRAGGPSVVVDLGTGSGAIALVLAHARADMAVYAVDRTRDAVLLARENAGTLGLLARIEFLEGDLFEPLGPLAGAVDLVISNPPYIASGAIRRLPREVREYEPLLALDGGPDGMALHRRIIAGAPRFLRPGAWLLMEMGETHSGRLSQALAEAGFQEIQLRKDMRGVERMIGARWR